MRNENYCIITGVLLCKTKNADNRDIKRPVADVEIVSTDADGNLVFEKISVLFADATLSKALASYNVGEIVHIAGELRSDSNGIYIEGETISRVFPKSERIKGLAIARANLLRLSQRFNLSSAIGYAKDGRVFVKREGYSRGDLKQTDAIPVFVSNTNEESPIITGKQVLCTGFLGCRPDSNGVSLCVSEMRELIQKENENG